MIYFQFLTQFGNVVVLGVLSLWLALWIALRVSPRTALAWLAVVAAVGVVTAVPKIWFSACGYAPWHVHSPSGHSSFSTVAYGGLALVLCAGESSGRKFAIGLLAALWVLAIGWSRVVVHAHTVQEVLVGIGVGVLGVAAFALMYRAGRHPGALWGVPAAMLVAVIAALPEMHLTLEPWLHVLAKLLAAHTPVCRAL